MRQLWKFVICATILTLCMVYAEETTAEEFNLTTTVAPNTASTTVETSEGTENGTTPEPLPTLAAKLVRQRRHPYTIIRHVVRQAKRGTKSRRRYKYPKYKYGPPSYNTGAPITYYKTTTKQYLPELPDAPKYSPIDETLDITNHFNIDNSYDFHPSSSLSSSSSTNGGGYEDQTMDLDFYSHSSGSGGKGYKQAPKLPTYSYASTKTEVSSKPLRSYGKSSKKHEPTYGSSSGGGGGGGGGDADYAGDESYNFSPPENTYDMHPMGSYDAPSSSQTNKFYDFTAGDAGSSHTNLHIPAAKYGVPDFSIPLHYSPPPAKQTEYHPQNPVSADSYVVYEKKIPNAGYSSAGKSSGQHHFAEPPANTKVEITYSPSYEITLPPAKHKPGGSYRPVEKYQPPPVENYQPPPAQNYQPPPAETYHPAPTETYHPAPAENYHPTPGHFAEPPPPPPPRPSTSYKRPKTKVHPPPPPPPTYRIPESPAPPSYKHTPAPPPPTPSYHAPETHAPPAPPIYYQEPEPESQEPNSYGQADLQESYESYETPESHAPTSFEQPESHAPTSFEQPEQHAPPSFQVPHPPIQEPADSFEVPEPHPPPVYSAPSAPSEQSPEPNYSITSPNSEYPQPDYITPAKELPINSNYMTPAYNYPKSSYEVPIYDPIPFEASSAEEHETFPPHNFVNQHIDGGHTPAESAPIPTSNVPATHTPSKQEDAEDTDAAEAPTRTTKFQRPSKKRKGLRNSTPTATTKHILDTPELEQAYEASQQKKKRNQLALSNDADVNESNHVEAQPSNEPKNYFLPTISPDTVNDHNYISPAWNPVRIRAVSTPTALPGGGRAQTPPPAPTTSIARSKARRQPVARTTTTRQQTATSFTPSHVLTRTRQTTPLHSEGDGGEQKLAAVTVDKSHSYSYYDGTSAPPNAKEAANAVQRARSGQKRQQQQKQHQHQQQQQHQQHKQQYQQQLTRTAALTTTLRQRAPTREQTTPQRTTKSVFETTYFKSPHNDQLERHLEQYVQNLPKNHKLF